MSNNEEQAWEGWRDEAATLVLQLRAGVAALERAIGDADAPAIVEAVQDIDAASEAIFRLRDGPEQPE